MAVHYDMQPPQLPTDTLTLSQCLFLPETVMFRLPTLYEAAWQD